ncbi:hypothetical protein HAX54_042986 [Datura stramonium]|uniref:Aminotransferase-like plant mobile domain-containing protein n=1 Tax=Datura stramonium TaxID=4076 RepID=A0ABS8W086_DATST|nr:hypothetical protein [Datura stramonium]
MKGLWHCLQMQRIFPFLTSEINFHHSNTLHPQLEIVRDKREPHARILALEVHPPVIGTFRLNREPPIEALHLIKWLAKDKINVLNLKKVLNTTAFLLKSSTHNEEVAATCPKVSEEEDVRSYNKEVLDRVKVYDTIFTSLFTYDINENVLRAFCELWHSMTNIICVGIGELSISLWDMCMIGGLPVHGDFYDEVVPSAKQLIQADPHGKPFFLKTCAYLFSAFNRLSKGASQDVSVHDWMSFWFKGLERYKEPSTWVPKQRAKPRSSENPSGHIDMSFLPRAEEENAPFIELGMEKFHREEMNLAAFLSCCFYKFIFPAEKLDNIHPSVFKVSSLMAHGEKFSLAIPVLTSICRGFERDLNFIKLGREYVTA